MKKRHPTVSKIVAYPPRVDLIEYEDETLAVQLQKKRRSVKYKKAFHVAGNLRKASNVFSLPETISSMIEIRGG